MKRLIGIAAIAFGISTLVLVFLIAGEMINLFSGSIYAAICSSGFALSASNYLLLVRGKSIRYTGILSILLFVLFCFHYFSEDLYRMLWNYLLAFHVIIIAYALWSLFPKQSGLLIAGVKILVFATLAALFLGLTAKIASPLYYDLLFYGMVVSTIGILYTLLRPASKKMRG